MREIKFRAWSYYYEKMLYEAEGIYDFETIDGNCFCCFDSILNHGNWNVMQYTGVKDVDGKEIYEGDIVLHKGEPFIVKYFDKYTRFALSRNAEENKLPMLMTMISNTKVIGNVCENPELLEVDE